MQFSEIPLKTPYMASHTVVPAYTQELMEQLVILFVVLVLANGDIRTNVESYPTAEACQKVEDIYWAQKPEVYEKADVVGMFTECLNIVPREVNDS